MLGIYCRISVDREGQRSIRDQESIGIKFAEGKNLPYQIYIDQGISAGGKIDKRPDFMRMIDDIENGKLDSVFVWNQDRLARQESTWFNLVDLMVQHHIKLYENGKLIDLDDSDVLFQKSISAAVDAKRRRDDGKNIIRTLKGNYKAGLVHGKPNFGYKKDDDKKMVIHKEHAEIVRKIYELNLKGWGQRRITDWLIENNIPNGRKNRKWGSTTVQHILKNPIYKGVRKIGGGVYKSPIIIDPIKWQRVQDSKNPSGKGNNYKYLLNKSLTCCKCGSRYTGRFLKNPHDNVYRCVTKQYKGSTCDNRGINQPKLEWFVWNKFFVDKKLSSLLKEWFITTDIEEKIQELNIEISKLQKELKKLDKLENNAVKLVMKKPEREQLFEREIKRIKKERSTINIRLKNLDEEMYEYKNSLQRVTSAENDLKNLNDNTPFNLKQDFIQKWISTIDIRYYEGIYILDFHFNVPNMKMETFVIDRYWKNMKEELKRPKYIPKF